MVRLLSRLVTVVSCSLLKCALRPFTFLLGDAGRLSPVGFLPCDIFGNRGDLPWVSRMVVSLICCELFRWTFLTTLGC
jgi:hypothetical protein